MIDSTLGTIYEDVANLQERVATLETQMSSVQTAISNLGASIEALTPIDSGWVNLTLENNVVSYSDTQIPRYRKIGNKVYLKGAVKNVLTSTEIATLPEGHRPNRSGHVYMQITSTANGANFARWVVETNGKIRVEAISHNATYGAEKWFPIHTEFLID